MLDVSARLSCTNVNCECSIGCHNHICFLLQLNGYCLLVPYFCFYSLFAILFIFFYPVVEPIEHITKVITWKRTTSSRSSSSRHPLATAAKDDVSDSGSEFAEDFCMIAGSNSSTLDRFYAWERKLYDEVKVLS